MVVGKGYDQTHGFDFKDTFSPIFKQVTIYIVLTITVTRKWKVHQLDINNAFLNGKIHEEVFMQQPQGFEEPQYPNYVCKFTKAIYGWNKSLGSGLTLFLKL